MPVTTATTPLCTATGWLAGSHRAVALHGRADASNFRELAEALFEAMGEGTQLLVDAGALSSVDELAVRSLAQAALVLRDRGGQLTLLRPQPHVLAELRDSGVTILLRIQP
jgi:anti-anti-sigma factor